MNLNLPLHLYPFMFLSFMFLEIVIIRAYRKTTKAQLKQDRNILGKYFAAVIFPAFLIFALYLKLGNSILYTFFISAAAGTMMEWFTGWWFENVIGTRLWTYHKYGISKYTSFLIIPVWGILGVFFFLIFKSIG